MWTTVLLFRTTFNPTIILNCWISVSLLKKRPRVQLSADSTPRDLNGLKRECYLRSDVRKRSDFVVFWHKDATMYTPSDLIHWKIRQVVKQPTHCSQTVGDVVTGVVVSLQFTLGGIHNSLIYKLRYIEHRGKSSFLFWQEQLRTDNREDFSEKAWSLLCSDVSLFWKCFIPARLCRSDERASRLSVTFNFKKEEYLVTLTRVCWASSSQWLLKTALYLWSWMYSLGRFKRCRNLSAILFFPTPWKEKIHQ